MIQNEKQYRITKALIRRLADSVFELAQLPQSKTQPWLRRGQHESLEIQIADLEKETAEYEALRSGKVKLAPLETIEAFPELLIKWRITKHWTQRQLAEKLSLAEQQIQRYEDTQYATATLETLKKVAAALRTDIKGMKARTRHPTTTLPKKYA
jgi:ribosome-binding protein aMBF1 (putative translation factor)